MSMTEGERLFDRLLFLDPFFSSDAAPILWADNVLKVGDKNQLRTRILIVTPVVLLLIKKKSFGRQPRIIKTVSIYDLLTVHVANGTVTFSGSESQIRIKHDEFGFLAFLVYHIVKTQFPLTMHPLTVRIPSDILEKYNESSMPYVPSSVLGDRLLSCAYYLGIPSNNSIPELFIINGVINIGRAQEMSAMLPAVLLSLSFDLSISCIKFSSVRISKILPMIQNMLLLNKNLGTFVFEDCNFEDCEDPVRVLFSQKLEAKISNIVFRSCTFEDGSFPQFFEALGTIPNPVSSLAFHDCVYDLYSLSSIFQSLLFNECFHSLQSFVMTNVTEPFDLADHIVGLSCCSWALLSKCLSQLCLESSPIEAMDLLSRLLKFDVGIRELSLKGHHFSESLVLQSKRSLTILDLSSSSFSLSSFISLFKCLGSGMISTKVLDLSNVVITEGSVAQLLEKANEDHVTFDGIEALLIDRMQLESDGIAQLARFLKRQSSLSVLSLSCSLNVKKSSLGILDMYEALCGLKLKYLSIGGDITMDYALGPLIGPLMKRLVSDTNLLSLDVSNQRLCDAEANCLIENMNKMALQELFFEGSAVSDIDHLCSFCVAVIGSSVAISKWPQSDFDRLLTTLPADADIDAIEQQICNVKEAFIDKFGEESACSDKSNAALSYLRPRIIHGEPRKEIYVESKTETSDSQIPIRRSGVSRRHPQYQQIFEMCVDTEADNYYEPILLAKERLIERFSPSSLQSQL